MSKDYQTMVRLTEPQKKFVIDESERLGVSISEILRRIIDDYRSPEKISVPIEGPEREWIDELAEAIGDTPGKAIRMALIHYRQVMEAPLATILKPTEEIIEELSRRD